MGDLLGLTFADACATDAAAKRRQLSAALNRVAGEREIPRELEDRVKRDAVLAVSLEPPGGSPTGQPTGPVIANGKLGWL